MIHPQFAELVAKYSAMKTEDNLKEMQDWLDVRRPFAHLRVNDGEALCMLGLRKPTERNNCGHLYMESLADALRGMMAEMYAYLQYKPGLALRVGSYWYTQGQKVHGLDEAARGLVNFLGPTLGDFPWCGSDDYVMGLPTGIPFQMFDLIRQRAIGPEQKPTFLIGNPGIALGRYCLGARFIPIHRTDCWNDTQDIMDACEGPASQGATFLWCCGMSKPWIWSIWRRHPHTTHIDLGHLFDGVFGDLSRAWLRRQDRNEPRWVAYQDQFIPYVRSYIPG